MSTLSPPGSPPPKRRRPSRIERRLLRQVAGASQQHDLLVDGDRVMVAVSGGKDSLALLVLLMSLRRRVPFRFDLIAVHVDQKQPGYQPGGMARWFEELGCDYRVVEQDTWSVVRAKVTQGQTPCALCSRLRRGILYRTAQELGCTKIALGHHRDDVNQTLLLNIFYSGQLKTMPPRLLSDDGRNVVIRPMIRCAEADIAAFVAERSLPVMPPALCGYRSDLKREAMKRLIEELARDNPKVPGNIFAATGNVVQTHLLDRGLRRDSGQDDTP